MKIAFIGAQEYFGTFRVLGAEVFDARDPGAAESAVAALDLSRYAAVFLTEDLVKTPFLEEFVKSRDAVVMIPATGRGAGASSRLLDEVVAKATGIR